MGGHVRRGGVAGDRIVGVIARITAQTDWGGWPPRAWTWQWRASTRTGEPNCGVCSGLPEVLPDVVPPSAGDRVRAAYLGQARDIAPERLIGRGAELDELVGFCAGDLPYAWWQAGPGGQVSADVGAVLHPPGGVDVVSFFITAGLAGETGRDACIAALIEQLAASSTNPLLTC